MTARRPPESDGRPTAHRPKSFAARPDVSVRVILRRLKSSLAILGGMAMLPPGALSAEIPHSPPTIRTPTVEERPLDAASARTEAVTAAATQSPPGNPAGVAGQPASPSPGFDPTVPGSELTVYVMTMGPGEFVWERFGHNAIWIHDEAQQVDLAYNWGLFSFDQEGFILRFLRGQMDYWMEGIDAELMAGHYISTDRSIWVQELNLTPEQRLALREFVEWNALPENRFYRYDYFRDNCSTRVRDAIDRALGGALRQQTDSVLTGTTYRSHSRAAVGESPVLYTGIMLGIGQPTDRDLTQWEEMFMPLQLMELIRGVTVAGPDGQPIPLVRSERQVYQSAQLSAEPAEPPPVLAYLGIGLLIAAGVMASVRSASRKAARLAFRILTIGWCSVAGILGTVLLLLWVATDHTAAYANENLFHFNPLLLLLAVLLPLAVTPGSRWKGRAFTVAAAVGGLSVAGFILGLLPWFYQENAELVALALPVNLALAAAAWLLRREALEAGERAIERSRSSPAPAPSRPRPSPA